MCLKLPALIVLFSLLITSPLIAAQRAEPAKAPKKSAAATPVAKAEDERAKRGKALLSQAEAEAGALEGEMRAYALLQAARAYATFDSNRAKEILDQSYSASQMNQEDTPSKTRLVQQILVAMAQTIPQRAEELLPYAPAEIRADVLNALLRQYLKKKEFDRAKEMVLRLAREGNFPYGAAAQLMSSLPKEDSMDRQAIFGAALTAFKASPENGRMMGMGGNDLGGLVVRFWRDLPVSLVKEAIDTVLEDAEKRAQSSQPARITVASSKNTSNFNSIYEYRAQQLLPVLRQIDEAEGKRLAERLKRLNPSLDPDAGLPFPSRNQGSPDQQGDGQLEFAMVGMGAPGPSPAAGRFMQMQRVMAIQNLALSKPEEALSQAAALDSEPRAMALEGIARVTTKKEPSSARKALDKLMESTKTLDAEAQTRHLAAAAEIYLRLEDKAGARKAIERGGEAAAKLYERDSDKEDSNQALKAYWPSSGAWKRLIHLATQVSQDLALSVVNEISDPEMRATQRLALAADLLGAQTEGTVTIVSQKGKPTRMMMEIGDGEGDADEEVSDH